MTMVTLFLTLDGVLHPRSTYIDRRGIVRCIGIGARPFQWHTQLAQTVEAHDAQIVVCSHWLQRLSLNQLRLQAPAWMRPRIVGACEQFEVLDDTQRVTRVRPLLDVIGDYVQSHGVRAWVALDVAGTDGLPPAALDDRIVVCDGAVGLSDPRAREQLTTALERERRRLGSAVHWPRVLSIDFDGILHPLGTGTTTIKTTLFGWLPVLEELLRPHDDVHVLVHSSWRYEYRPEELQMLLGELGVRFVGAVPRGQRYESVLWWLQMNPTFTSYRILDDDASEFPDPPPAELILCDPSLGVSDPRVKAELRAWLTNR